MIWFRTTRVRRVPRACELPSVKVLAGLCSTLLPIFYERVVLAIVRDRSLYDLHAAARAHKHTNPTSTQSAQTTMCPLRYILLLLSLLVAMIGLSQAMSEQEMAAVTDGSSENDDDETRKPAQQQKTTFRTLIDMLNGKYLYDAYKTSQMRVKAE